MTRRYDVLMDGGFPYLVAALEGRVVGYAYAGAYRPRPAYRFTVENSVYLQPAIHRRGMRLQLLQRLIAEWETRGYRQIIAVIGNSPPTRDRSACTDGADFQTIRMSASNSH